MGKLDYGQTAGVQSDRLIVSNSTTRSASERGRLLDQIESMCILNESRDGAQGGLRIGEALGEALVL